MVMKPKLFILSSQCRCNVESMSATFCSDRYDELLRLPSLRSSSSLGVRGGLGKESGGICRLIVGVVAMLGNS
jgi:hypothetical protein